MEDIDSKIKYYEQKIKETKEEYFKYGISKWNAIREKEISYIIEIYYLNKIKEERIEKERALEFKDTKIPDVKKEASNKDKNSNEKRFDISLE